MRSRCISHWYNIFVIERQSWLESCVLIYQRKMIGSDIPNTRRPNRDKGLNKIGGNVEIDTWSQSMDLIGKLREGREWKVSSFVCRVKRKSCLKKIAIFIVSCFCYYEFWKSFWGTNVSSFCTAIYGKTLQMT